MSVVIYSLERQLLINKSFFCICFNYFTGLESVWCFEAKKTLKVKNQEIHTTLHSHVLVWVYEWQSQSCKIQRSIVYMRSL